MRAIVRCPKPVIAAVQGTATAAGCQLVATCDLAVAAEDAQLRHARRQHRPVLLHAHGGAVAQRARASAAMEMLLLGEMLPARDGAADTASSIAWCRPAKVMDEALALAELIASKPPRTLTIGKEAFYRQIEMPLADAYDYAAEVMVENMLHAEAEEGIGAFLDKRQPDWARAERVPRSRAPQPAFHAHESRQLQRRLHRRHPRRAPRPSPWWARARTSNRPSYFAMKYLLGKGYRVIPVNPGLAGKEILGQPVFAALADVPAAGRHRRHLPQLGCGARGGARGDPPEGQARHQGDLDAARRAQRRGGRGGRGRRPARWS